MKDVIVSLRISRVHGMLTEYVRRLSASGIEVAIDPASGQSFGIGEKLQGIRSTVDRFAGYELLVLSDGWDVMFYGTKKLLMEKVPRDKVLWAAEKNCWPDAGMVRHIPDRGPWRFVNGGLLAGTPNAFLEMCDRIEAHPIYNPALVDQGFMNFLLAQNETFFEIDTKTNLFFCLHLGYDELEFKNGRPFNSLYRTFPLFVHANGHWPTEELQHKYRESLTWVHRGF
jgi:hypothetical protein